MNGESVVDHLEAERIESRRKNMHGVRSVVLLQDELEGPSNTQTAFTCRYTTAILL